LHAWRRVALAAELWPEVVEAAEREAAVAHEAADKARLYHLAACAAMDRGVEPDKAIENLRRVLVLDPRHDDALVRLRQLYTEQGRYEDLVQILLARVEHETDRARLVELHGALAALFRDFLADAERAKTHLRAVLARDPVNAAAVAALSDLAWEQGHWQEAADALIQRARLEKNPRVLKDVFYRLGTIYAEKLPDPRWALKSFERVLSIDPDDDGALEQLSRLAIETQDWRLALGATEKLIGIDTVPEAKIEHLHRVARIQQEGFREPKRAEDALKRALDVDPADPRTLDAITAFYGAQKDLTSLRVQMDRVAGSMRTRLKRDAHDATAYRVMSRALAARARANVIGSIEAARCAAELAHALGGAEDQERMLAAEALRTPTSARGLGDLAVDDALFHPSIPSGFRQIFRLLHDTLAKRYAPELRRWGVGKADKLPRSGHPVKDIALAVAADLGIADVDVYVSQAQPTALGVELTDPLTLILGAHLAHAEKPPQLKFAVGRALKLAVSYMGVPARLTPEELGALLGGVIRQYDANYASPGISVGLVAEEQQRLGRLISKRLRDEVYPFASEVAGLEFDPRALWAGVQHTGNRAGLIASSSALAGLVVLLRIGNHKDIPSTRGDVLIEEFMRFAVSDEHAEVRRVLATGPG
jgi:tetratricopeptide (TPR) repeat protein